MAKRFRPVDRDQQFLLPPDMRDWLCADHLVWFVLDTVAALDLAGFRLRYRLGGVGRAAYDPAMMVGLLIYGYAVGQRSSRQIERLCAVDVAFRIACAGDAPDHATIARFRAEHERPLAELFEQVLRLCARAGMGKLGTVALDGTRIAADASLHANRSESTLRTMAQDIVAEAGEVDAAEDGLFGQCRGDELPDELADPRGRVARIGKILADLEAERGAAGRRGDSAGDGKPDKAEQRVARAREVVQKTRAELAERARQRAERERAAAARGTSIPGTRPVPVDEHTMLRQAQARLERAQAALEQARHTAAQPVPPAKQTRQAKRNLTDPDSRIMKTWCGWVQGYNGQLVVSADYLILAAELSNDPTDVGQYQPMISATCDTVARINAATGIDWNIGCVLADAGYASNDNLTAAGPDRLIALGTSRASAAQAAANPTTGDPPEHASPRARMDHRLRTPEGAALYRQRGAIAEPVNGHIKDRRALRRFTRRGLTAARSEFRFAATVTNLLRLHSHLATA